MQLFPRLFKGFLGTTESDDVNAKTGASPGSHQTHLPDEKNYKALSESLGPSFGQKRRRELDGEVEEVHMAKRPRERSKDERRLLPGHEDVPADAQEPEPVQAYRNMEAPARASAKKAHARSANGNFKPVNTLDRQPHGPKSTADDVQYMSFRGIRKIDQPRTQLAKTKEPNIPARSQTLDEKRFSDHDERMAKRRRLDHIDTSSPESARPMDDSIFDKSPADYFGFPLKRSAQKPIHNPLNSLLPPRETSGKHSELTIARQVDMSLGHGQGKNRRKSKDSAPLSQPSTAASPNLSPAYFGSGKRHAGTSPLAATPDDEIEIVSEYCRTTANEPKHRANQKGAAPEVDSNQRLADQFRRDIPEVVEKPRLRARQRMMATSNQFENSHARRASTSSGDELAVCETTVSGHRPRRELREDRRNGNKIEVPKSQREEPSHRSRARQSEQSGIDAARPYSGRKIMDSIQPDRLSESVSAQHPLSIDRIFCRACCLEDGNIDLIWDPSACVFHVACNGSMQAVPNRETLIEIGKSELQRLYHAEDHLAVFVKGAASPISNGRILLEFSTRSSFEDFVTLLQSTFGKDLQWESVLASKMEGFVMSQGRDIRIDHENHSQKTVVHRDPAINSAAEMKLMKARERRRQAEASEEEQIKYEPSDSDPVRPSRRSLMRIRDTEGDRALPTTSKYSAVDSFSPRRSSRQPKPTEPKAPVATTLPRWTHENQIERWLHSVVYPPEGATRRVTVDFDDIERLDEGEFLNDNLISFALRRIEENMTPKHKDKVHFFNSFFYEALTKKNGKRGFYYDAVSRWTKNKDLFTFPYVVVPINLSNHWFVAIICNLNRLPRKHAEIDLGSDDSATEQTPALPSRLTESDDLLVDQDPELAFDQLSLSARDMPDTPARKNSVTISFEGDGQVPLHSQPSPANGKKGRKRAPPPSRKYDPDAPTIITLDSLGGAHASETRILKDYLNAEGNSKRGMEVDSKGLQGLTAKGIPEQTNFCDCGVFLVGYIEEFAKDPRKFVTKVLQRELDEQNDFASFDASAKRAEIREELLKLQVQQEAARKAKKAAKKPAQSAALGLQSAPPVAANPSTETARSPNAKGDAALHLAASSAESPTANAVKALTSPSLQGHEPEDIPMSVPRALPPSLVHDASAAVDRFEEKAMEDSKRTEEVPDSQEAAISSAFHARGA